MPTEAPNRFAFLEILRLTADGLQIAGPPPNWQDPESVRDWFRRLLPSFGAIAARTVTTFDEATAALISTIITDDDLWTATMAMIADLQAPSSPCLPQDRTIAAITKACSKADGNRGSFDPNAVMAITATCIDMIRACRSGVSWCSSESPVDMVKASTPEAEAAEPLELESTPDSASDSEDSDSEEFPSEPEHSEPEEPGLQPEPEPPSTVETSQPRVLTLAQLGIVGHTAEILTEHGLTTSGAILENAGDQELVASLVAIKGIGDERADNIHGALVAHGVIPTPPE